MTVKITVDNNTIIRFILVGFGVILGLRFFSALVPVLTLVIVAFFLALALNPPVSYLASKMPRDSRILGTGAAYLIVLFLIGSFIYTVVPPLLKQTSSLVSNIPSYVDDIKREDGAFGDFIKNYNIDNEVDDFVDNITSNIGTSGDSVFSGINRVGLAIVSVLTVLVLTFLMLIEGPRWLDMFWGVYPAGHRKEHQHLALRMYNVVTNYVNGQLIVALLAALTSMMVMLIVGVPFAIPLAGLVGAFVLIPLIGATLGSAIVVAVALFNSVTAAIIMLAFFIVYQQFENNVIQPFVQSRTLDMSPLMVFVAVLIGITTGGILGAFVAIPVAGSVKVIFEHYSSSQQVSEERQAKRRILRRKKKTAKSES